MTTARVAGTILLGGILSCATPQMAGRTEASPEQVKARLEAAANSFLSELRSVLLREMQRGAFEAVSVCSDSAQVLTGSIGERYGVSIRRTSERYRNPANEPTQNDRAVLERFARLLEEGAKVEALEEFEQSDGNGGVVWRLAKPIMVSSSACLKCHGSGDEISPEIREFLSTRYPGDRAQGYRVGDFRGAVIVSEITPKNDGAF